MISIDAINIFLSFWLKPMIVLWVMVSIAKNSCVFSASARHWLFVSTLLALVVGLLVWVCLPNLGVHLIPPSMAGVTTIPVNVSAYQPLFLYLIFIVYVLGAVWTICFQLFGLFDICRTTRSAALISAPQVLETLDGVCDRLKVTKNIGMRETDKVDGPVMWGYKHPVILLPSAYSEWSLARLERVLAHEVSHVKRNDWIIKALSKAICAIFWAVPLVWYVSDKMHWFAELACDDHVVEKYNCRTEYAEDLMTLSSDARHSGWVLNFNRSSNLFLRIQHVLDGRNQRVSLPLSAKCFQIIVCFAIVIPVSALQAMPRIITSPDVELNSWSLDFRDEVSVEKEIDETNTSADTLMTRFVLPVEKTFVALPDQPAFEEALFIYSNAATDVESSVTENSGPGKVNLAALSTLSVPRVDIKGVLPQRLVTPIYPRSAIDRGIEGLVIVQFTINEAGNVEQPRIVHSQPRKVFDRAVIKALKKSQYRPMEIEGRATKIKNVTESYYFRLFESATDKPVEIKRPKNLRIAEFE